MKSLVASVMMAVVVVVILVSGCTSSYSGQSQTTMVMTTVPTGSSGAPASVTTPMDAAAAPGSGQNVQMTLTCQNIAFDKSSLTAPAGSHITMTFVNNDAGIPHNFALYTDSSAKSKIFVGDIVTGVKTTTYTFGAPSTPGTYFFRCDVHPTMMYGTFVVT